MTQQHSLRPVAATIAGQAVAAIGILVQWAAAPAIFPGFPPGIVFIAGAAGIVWLDRRATWSPVTAIALSAWIVLGGIAGGDLINNLMSADSLLVAGNIIMVAGLCLSAVAAVFTIVHNRRTLPPEARTKPLSHANPRRAAIIATTAGLLVAAIGDAAPEGLDVTEWDGPGPVLFLLLAIMVALIPGRFTALLAIVLSSAFVVGALTNPESVQRLTTPVALLGFSSGILQLLGLLTAIGFGIVSAIPASRGRVPTRSR